MATRLSDPALSSFYRALSASLALAPVRAYLPDGVTASRRGDSVFTMNWTAETKTVPGSGELPGHSSHISSTVSRVGS